MGLAHFSIGYVLIHNVAALGISGTFIGTGCFRRQVFVGLGKRHVVNSYRQRRKAVMSTHLSPGVGAFNPEAGGPNPRLSNRQELFGTLLRARLLSAC